MKTKKLTTGQIVFMARLEVLESKGKLDNYYSFEELPKLLECGIVTYYNNIKFLRNKDIIAIHQTFINNQRVSKIFILKKLNQIL